MNWLMGGTMQGDLASVRDTVDLSAREVLDKALAFLTAQGYHTTERTDTSLTVERSDQGDGDESDQPHLTVLALPQPEGGVQVSVRGNDLDGMQERQSEWADWANGLPKKAASHEATERIEREEPDAPLPAPSPASKPVVASQKTMDPPNTQPASTQVVFDRPDQLEKVRAGLLPGEVVEAVFDVKGSGSGFMGITSKRVIFQDNAWISQVKAVVSIPYSRIHTVAAADTGGLLAGRGFFSSSTIVVTTSAGARTFQFRGADKAHIAHDLILKHII
jgi:hypothetical protein